ncbi:MAG TPA: LLM class flavin-dependent oxidoreductase, partial [Pseudomonadales bacterium]|nr:LLM class flavin-dependent oxidoreductase [Pseudomonadales bacterium]
MKIRIGVGASGASSTPEALGELVASIDELGFDSLWLSEVLTGPVIDPAVGLAWAAASNPRVKLGTTMLLPGRNVLRLAKQLASLDVLCRGRLLVTLVPGLTYPPEREAIGVEPKQRGAVIDEALPLLRRLWAGETVSHEGATGTFQNVKLSPLPVQQPLEVWLGGTVPSALERCGRLSDGWLPSLCTPEEAAAGRVVIEEAAAKAGRSISGEHFGMSIGYASKPIDPATARVMAARR